MLHSSNVDFVSLDAMIELIRCWEISTAKVDGIDLTVYDIVVLIMNFAREK